MADELEDFKAKLATLQFQASGRRVARSAVVDGNKATEVVRDDNGGTAGIQIEHPSGRLDAIATPGPIESSSTLPTP